MMAATVVERLQRQQTYKKRQKAGVWVAPTLVSFEMLGRLIAERRLSDAGSRDRAAIGRVVTEYMAEKLGVEPPVD